jgi:hypothetical protein
MKLDTNVYPDFLCFSTTLTRDEAASTISLVFGSFSILLRLLGIRERPSGYCGILSFRNGALKLIVCDGEKSTLRLPFRFEGSSTSALIRNQPTYFLARMRGKTSQYTYYSAMLRKSEAGRQQREKYDEAAHCVAVHYFDSLVIAPGLFLALLYLCFSFIHQRSFAALDIFGSASTLIEHRTNRWIK